jgi:AMP-polyphosphate phosphotransferase
MLETIDLSRSLDKKTYSEWLPTLKANLALLQRRAFESGLTTTVVFEGWDAAGKGDTIAQLVHELDPRGFKVETTKSPTENERMRPFLWRFWLDLPANGAMGIFDRSWYTRVLGDRVEGRVDRREWQQAYQEINQFERQLTDAGQVIVKFFLHISKKEQKKRFKDMEQNEAESWRITKDDWKENKRYGDHLAVIEEMLERTNTASAPWTIVESTNRRYRHVKVLQTMIQALEEGLQQWEQRQEMRGTELGKQREDAETAAQAAHEAAEAAAKVAADQEKAGDGEGEAPESADVEALVSLDDALAELPTVLDSVDLSKRIKKGQYNKQVSDLQSRLRELEFRIYSERIPVIIAYEGWDAGGKGGNIKRATEVLDPRGYHVVPISAPKGDDASHHYLWRFWRNLPKAGHIAIYDRTWYGRVLVERVENLITRGEWRRSYQEINEFEQMLVNYGTVIVKFWIHISAEEQLRRFEDRQRRPEKHYKITDEDWRNREKWPLYESAVVEMIERTSTSYAPWTILEGEQKRYARVRGLETMVDAIERGLNGG